MIKLHLGCGDKTLPKWDNLDIVKKHPDVIQHDLKNALPYQDNSVSFIFNEHFIEHLEDQDGTNFLEECFRVLKIDGILRISCPDLDYIVHSYISNNIDRSDLGLSFRNKAHYINSALRNWGHRYLYNEEDLLQKLKKCGFSSIERKKYHFSNHTELAYLEFRSYTNELIMEATKK